MLLNILVSILTILLVCCIIAYISYIILFKKIDDEYKLKLMLNSRYVNRGFQNCPNGCVDKKCVYKKYCVNCNGNDPECCCNDEQCSKC